MSLDHDVFDASDIEASVVDVLLDPLIRIHCVSYLEEWMFTKRATQALAMTVLKAELVNKTTSINVVMLHVKQGYPELKRNELTYIIDRLTKHTPVSEDDFDAVIKIVGHFIKDRLQLKAMNLLTLGKKTEAESLLDRAVHFRITADSFINPTDTEVVKHLQALDMPASGKIMKSSLSIVNRSSAYKGYKYGDLILYSAPPGCMTGDTVVPLLDGTESTLEDLYLSKRKDIGVYSCDLSGQIKASVAKECVLTKYVDELVHITVEDGTTLRVTKEHPMLLIDGTYKEANKLLVSDILMPMKKGVITPEIRGSNYYLLEGYEYVVNRDNDYVMTHRLSGDYVIQKDPSSYDTDLKLNYHHSYYTLGKFSKLNNDPKYIKPMTARSHFVTHIRERSTFDTTGMTDEQVLQYSGYQLAEQKRKLNKVYFDTYGRWPDDMINLGDHKSMSTEFTSEKTREMNNKNWQDPDYQEWMRTVNRRAGRLSCNKRNAKDENGATIQKVLSVRKYLNVLYTEGTLSTESQLEEEFYNTNRKRSNGSYTVGPRTPSWLSAINYYKGDTERMFSEAVNYNNHTVLKVELVSYSNPVPVYDLLDVDIYHNYAVKLNDGTYVFSHNTGKSTLMIQEGAAFADQGFKVAHMFFGDMSRFDGVVKYIANIESVLIENVINNVITHMSSDTVKRVMENVRIAAYPALSKTVNDVIAEAKNLRKKFNFDVLIIDYDSNILPPADNMYEAGGIMYSSFKGFAQGENCAVLIASQPKISNWEQEIIGMDSASESSRKQHVVDYMITIGRNPKCKKVGTIFIPKVRRGEGQMSTKVRLDYAYSRVTEISLEDYNRIVVEDKVLQSSTSDILLSDPFKDVLESVV